MTSYLRTRTRSGVRCVVWCVCRVWAVQCGCGCHRRAGVGQVAGGARGACRGLARLDHSEARGEAVPLRDGTRAVLRLRKEARAEAAPRRRRTAVRGVEQRDRPWREAARLAADVRRRASAHIELLEGPLLLRLGHIVHQLHVEEDVRRRGGQSAAAKVLNEVAA